MTRLSPQERLWVVSLLVLMVCLGVKSYWLDPWEPQGTEERLWAESAQRALAEEPVLWPQFRGILKDRIVAVEEMDPIPGTAVPVLKITVRKYIGGYLPIGDRKLTVSAENDR